jgi:carbamoyltransferase
VYNFGLPGTGTDQHYLAYREHARGIEHDIVVVAVLVENIRRIVARFREFTDDAGAAFYLAKPYFTADAAGGLTLHGVPVSPERIQPHALAAEDAGYLDRGGDLQGIRKLVNAMGPSVKERIQRLVRQNPVPAYDSPDDPAWWLMRSILLDWARVSEVPVVVMPLPLYHHVEEISDPSAYQARFQELHGVGRMAVHDPLPALRAFPREERRNFRFPHDIHPTPAAHAVIGESLAGALRSILPASAMR